MGAHGAEADAEALPAHSRGTMLEEHGLTLQEAIQRLRGAGFQWPPDG